MTATDHATDSLADRQLVITREYDAPARLLFEAWSKPEHLMRWFGPEGYPLTMCEVDFRVGGRFRFAMTGPDGVQNPPFGGEYREIVPNEKIVFTDKFELPDAEELVMTVTFDEHDGKTTQTLTTLFRTAAVKEEHLAVGMDEGLNSSLDQLAGVVGGMPR
jgi:uncharacterized protein YndB with AHSA1/START domain